MNHINISNKIKETKMARINSRIYTSIKALRKQGFLALPFKQKGKKIPALPGKTECVRKKEFDGIPSQSEGLRRPLTDEEWNRIVKHRLWKDVTHVALVGGHNGVAIFDFDIKGLKEENLNLALDYWGAFKRRMKGVTGGEYYLERSPSGGEHLIFLISGTEEDFKNHLPSTTTTTPWGVLDGVRFVELLGFNNITPGKTPSGKTCNISPSPDYTKLEGKDLVDLQRVSPSVVEQGVKLFKSFAPTQKISEFKKSYAKTPITVRQKELAEHLEELKRKNDLGQMLERCGYKRCSDTTFLAPGSTTGNAGVKVIGNGTKFMSFHSSDVFCDGLAHDIVDLVLHQNGGNWQQALQELGGDASFMQKKDKKTKYAEKKAENGINIVRVLVDNDTNTETYVIKKADGKEILVTNRELSQKGNVTSFILMHFKFYISVFGITKAGSAFLENIAAASELAPTFNIADSRRWVDGRFVYSSGENTQLEKMEPYLRVSGTLDDWLQHVGTHAKDHRPSVFAMVAAFAASLCFDVRKQLFAINISGNSQVGKTTALLVANSLTTTREDFASSRVSGAGLSVELRRNAYRAMILDEFSKGTAELFDSMGEIFGIASRARAKWTSETGTLSRAQQIRSKSILISASERCYSEVFKTRGVTIEEGGVNRFLDIKVEKGDSPKLRSLNFSPIAREIELATEEYHGAPMEEFLKRIPNLEVIKSQWKDYQKNCWASIPVKERREGRANDNFLFLVFVAELVQSLNMFPSNFNFVEAVKFYWDKYSACSTGGIDSGRGILKHAVGIFVNGKYYRELNSQQPLFDRFIHVEDGGIPSARCGDEKPVSNRASDAYISFPTLLEHIQKVYPSCSGRQLKDILLAEKILENDRGKAKRIPGVGGPFRLHTIDLDVINNISEKMGDE